MTHTVDTFATLDDWIAREAIPCSLDDRQGFDAAVDTIVGKLGDAVPVLSLGEALHGGTELLVLRNQLFRRLAEAHGYSAIAIESSFPQSSVVNDYVLGRGPASYDAVEDAGFSHGFGKFVENRALAEWMRQYNADPAHPVKLHVYGFDSPTDMAADSPRQILHVVLAYLDVVAEPVAQDYRSRIEPLLGEDAAWANPAAALDPTQSIGLSPAALDLQLLTEKLIDELRPRRIEFIARSDESSYDEAIHYAVMARHLLDYHAKLAIPSDTRQNTLLGIRSTMMAKNMAYIIAREEGRGNTLVFAHNNHLKRSVVQWQWGDQTVSWRPVGSYLHSMLGQQYAVIGSAIGSSPVHGIGQGEAGTLEARLISVPGPLRFIPTHQGQGLPATEIAALPVRAGSTTNRSYMEPLGPQSFTDFDWFAVLDTTGYSREGWPYL